MATLSADEKTKIRRALADVAQANDIPITWVKAAVNDAAQAVEDLLVNNAEAISTAIDTASQPHGVTFTVAQKKALVAWTLFVKYERDK
jgi:hypothetical protein